MPEHNIFFVDAAVSPHTDENNGKSSQQKNDGNINGTHVAGELEGHGGTQPCIQAKSTKHPRRCVGRSPTIFLFFSCKNHLIQVKDSQ